MTKPDWLPALIEYASFDGSYDAFLEATYDAFCQDFIRSKPRVPHRRFALKRHPVILGKEATFWHLVSEGKNESERLPDLRRAECIRWARPVIERAWTTETRTWRNERNREERIVVALPDFSYVVVLADRHSDDGRFVLLWTAYLVERDHQRRRFEQEYTTWMKAQAPKS